MKKSLLLILVAGFILASGLFGYRILHRTGSAGVKKSENVSVPVSGAPAPAVSQEQQSATVAPRRLAAVKNPGQPQPALQVVSAPGDRFQPLDEALILDRRVTAVSSDRKKRELLVKADGKYPFRRIEETLVKNDGAETYSILSRTEMVANHVLVKLQDGKTEDDLRAMLKNYGVSILRPLTLPGHYIISLKAPTLDAVPEALSVFSGESNVLAYTEPDFYSRMLRTPNDSSWSNLWGMVKINATGAWDTATGSTNVIVAVIDTGVDLTHPDLVSNLWINAAEANGTPGVDDDGDGFIDDTNGWDFANSDNMPLDDVGHGTHCAGTIGAVGNNGLGVAGVCWRVRLMALKALGTDGGTASDIAEAVRYAADKGARIISASYGGSSYSDTARDAIIYANSNGVLFVAAAGNDGANNDLNSVYPSSYDIPNIVSVAATDQGDALASFSNYGKTSVDLAAPGVAIYSTIPGGTNATYELGTSMACPHVSGAAALLLSAKPSLTHLQLKQALLKTVDLVPSLTNKTVSGGRLNVYKMLTLLDTDGDGMSDNWEQLYFSNPTNALPGNDPDSDGLTNLEEYSNGTNPGNPDTDGDTLPDGWEVAYGFDPNSPAGGSAVSSRRGIYPISGGAKNIAVTGNYAYVAAGSAGLGVLNISDPQNPVLAGSCGTGGTANDVAVAGNYAYVADGANGLTVIDVTTPAAPWQAGWTNTPGTAEGIAVRSNYVYLADGANNLVTFNVSNPALPQLTKDDYYVDKLHDVFVQGASVYAAVYQTVWRFSLTNSAVPVLKAAASGLSWDMIGIHGNGTSIVAVAGVNGVKIMNTNLTVRGSYDTDGTASGVFVSGNYAYIADGANGLVVLNITIPSAPTQVVHVATYGTTANGVCVSGDKVYVATSAGVEIFSILLDSDSDGLPDSWEIQYFGNLLRNGTLDWDSDGISDRGEYLAGTNPKNTDSDGDGLSDGLEVFTYGTNPANSDTDGDGLSDGAEILTYGTNPLVADTDGDGFTDGFEVAHGFNPLIAENPAITDHDGDGLTDDQEITLGTDPVNVNDPIWVDDDAPGDVAVGGEGDSETSDPLADGSEVHPFDAIQKAIDSALATNGITVLVNDGAYYGPGNYGIDTKGKALKIRSWNGAAVTTINSYDAGSVFNLSTGEGTNTVIQGFSMTSFSGEYSVVVLDGVSVQLKNCWIYNSLSSGIECLNAAAPLVSSCTVYNVGNGIYSTSAGLTVQDSVISNCTGRGIVIVNDDFAKVTWSTIENCAGGITLNGSDAEISQCIVRNNTVTNGTGAGILLMGNSSPRIQNALIVSNRAEIGGGLYISTGCNPTGVNCTVAGNYARTSGGGLATDGKPVLRNMILWGNTAVVSNKSIHKIMTNSPAIAITYSCVEGGFPTLITGAVTNDPLFVGDGDYHLASTNSPCYNSGTFILAPTSDLDGNPRPTALPQKVDMGCYEGIGSGGGGGADTDGDGMPDTWENDNGLNPLVNDAALDPDGDGLSNLQEYQNGTDPHDADTDDDGLTDGVEVNILYTKPTNIHDPVYVDDNASGDPAPGNPNISDSLENGSAAHPFDSIQKAISTNTTVNGMTIFVTNGLYEGTGNYNISPQGKNLRILSWNGSSNTTIKTHAYGSAFLINSGETTNTIIQGFTIETYGDEAPVEGVVVNGASPVLQDLVIHNCELEAVSCINGAAPRILNCRFYDVPNGLYANGSAGVLLQQSVISNTTGRGIVIVNDDLAQVTWSTVENCAGGITLNGSDAEIRQCIVRNNTDINGVGAGILLTENSSPRIQNALIVSNRAGTGGGLYISTGCNPTGVNCTVANNSAVNVGGGVSSGGRPVFRNMIFWGNTAASSSNLHVSANVINIWYSDIQYGHSNAVLCITNNPLFVGGGDCHLASTNSPCYDSGDFYLAPTNDLDGNPRPTALPQKVDMGCYEGIGSGGSGGGGGTDTDGDGMPDAWEIANGLNPSSAVGIDGASGDPDGDGLTNLQEYTLGTNPQVADTDADGLPDGWEVNYTLSPTNTVGINGASGDPDIDGLTNLQEYTLGTNPQVADTDGDGMPDGWEFTYMPPLNPTNSLDGLLDSDLDGLTNKFEYSNGCNPANSDTDADGMPDGWEVNYGLSPISTNGVNGASGDPDSDNLLNIQEYSLGSSNLWLGVYTSVTGAPATFFFGPPPTNPTPGMPGSTHPNVADSDGDGLPDYYEITTNGAVGNLFITNPNNPDTDGDGFSDSWEIANGFNPIVVEDPLATDRDHDGLTDAEEEALGTQPNNANDPIFVDDDGPNDRWPGNPDGFGPAVENGTISNAYDSIQQAVNAATNGITVLINDGEYFGTGNYNIDTAGKAITIRAWSTNAPTGVIVNSLGLGPVFTMSSEETTNTVLQGLSITVTLNDCSDGDCDYQHAIALNGASPLIKNCLIYDTQLDGIHCENNASPVVLDCIIYNVLNGVWCESGSSPRIENCTILDIGHDSAGDVGIGIYADSSSGLYVGGTVINNCNGRGISLKDSADTTLIDTEVADCRGGITCDNSSPRIERCEIRNNNAPNYYSVDGHQFIGPTIFPLNLTGWTDTTDENENGGGILMLRGSSPFIVNCLVINNRTWADDPGYSRTKLVPDFGLGGGLYIGEGCSPTGANCTVADNHANTRGGGFSSFESPYLRNMIFWGNTASNAAISSVSGRSQRSTSDSSIYRNLHCRSGSIDITYSDIQYGYASAKNSTTNNPLFVGDGDYQLTGTNSPCYNTAGPDLTPTNDLVGFARPTEADWPDRVDMGCYEFADNDGDGMNNVWERANGLDPEDSTDAALDPDTDGLTNLQEYQNATDPNDPDTDGDGLNDGDEVNGASGHITDPNDPDSDDDGLNDADEVLAGTNPNDPDTDDDKMPDGWEVFYSLNPLVNDAAADADSDGLTNLFEYQTGTNPNSSDTDGDGMPDQWEINNGLNPGINDASLDADNDGLTNLDEYNRGTKPNDSDTDDDGVSDGDEVTAGTNPLDPDTDRDGMSNGWEIDHGLNPELNDAAADADSDGLTNLGEYQHGTDPQVADSDGDGMSDGWEVTNGFDPLVNDAAADVDSDGLTNLEEYTAKTNPNDTDTDNDGMLDGWEVDNGLNPLVNNAGADADSDGLTNFGEYQKGTDPNDADTDNDGMPDGWEVAYAPPLDPLVNDASGDPDLDTASNLYEYQHGTDPTVLNPEYVDTDGDGMPDGWETTYGLNPLVDDASGDLDSDGLTNLEEYQHGTEPNNPDTDGDGINDGDEVALGTNPANWHDPVYVDDNALGDPEAGNPNISNTNENGSVTYPFDSIQEAIDSTNTASGMTILVTNGLYEGTGNYDINPHGKELRILSRNGSANTTIKTHAYGSAFIINSGETTNTVIQGFSIETLGDKAPVPGIVVSGASPVIKDCAIHNCGCVAISCSAGAAPRILNCLLYDAKSGLYADGSAGVLLQESVVRNTFKRGVVIMNDDLAQVTWSTIENCGGGITLDNSDASIRQCTIRNNEALNYYTADGIERWEPVQFNLTTNYTDTTSSDENGAGVLILNGSSPLLQNCLITGNKTWADDPNYSGLPGTALGPEFGLGGGIYLDISCNPTGVNCTVADNYANTLGGGLSSAGRPLFRNMIFWGNTSSNATIETTNRITSTWVDPNLNVITNVINIWFSDIQYGHANAVLSITANPQFVGGGDYSLQAGSPCIEAGTYYLAPLVDIDGNLRPTFADYPVRVDMGCYQFGAPAATNPIALGAELPLDSGPALGAEASPLADTDGDGVSNGAEMIAGTDAYSPSSYFRVYHEQSQADGSVLIAWQSVAGCLYTVQSTDNLISGIWDNVAGFTDLSGDGTIKSYSASRDSAVRYYRVMVRRP